MTLFAMLLLGHLPNKGGKARLIGRRWPAPHAGQFCNNRWVIVFLESNRVFTEQSDSDRKQVEDGRLADLLSELRVMLAGAQMLTAFLILLPFNDTFEQIVQFEKYVFLATFFLAVSSIVLLSAPAIQHRILNPLRDRLAFKRMAIRHLVAGGVTMALAFVLATNLVISQVFGALPGVAAAVVIAVLIVCLWLLLPLYLRRRARSPA